jgi:sugar phosphate isomerase/epimerase
MAPRLRICASIPALSEDRSLCLEAMGKASELGMTGIEIKLGRDDMISTEMRLFLLDSVPSYDVAVHAHLPYLQGPANLASPSESLGSGATKIMLESLGFAASLGCSLVNSHIGVDTGEGSHLEISAGRLGPICEMANDIGIEISMENQESKCHGILNTPQDLEALLDLIPGAAITYDPGHGNTHGFGPREFLPVCIGNLRYLHLHDNPGDWDRHLPLGRGNLDFRYLLDEIGRGKKGNLVIPATLELKSTDFEQSLGYLRKMARGSIALI